MNTNTSTIHRSIVISAQSLLANFNNPLAGDTPQDTAFDWAATGTLAKIADAVADIPAQSLASVGLNVKLVQEAAAAIPRYIEKRRTATATFATKAKVVVSAVVALDCGFNAETLADDLDYVESLTGTYDADSEPGYYPAVRRVFAAAKTLTK